MARESDGARGATQGLSLDEMKAIAAEAGLDPVLVERAAHRLPGEGRPSGLERVLGGPLKHRLEAEFDGPLTRERAGHLLASVRAGAEQQGEGSADATGMTWHSVGEGTQMLVTAISEGESTRARIILDRRPGLAVIGTATILGSIMASIATIVGLEIVEMQSLLLGWSILIGVIVACFGVGRAVWSATGRSLRERMDAMMDVVTRSLDEPDE